MFLFASFNVKITIKVRMVDFKLKTPKDKYNHPTPSKQTNLVAHIIRLETTVNLQPNC